MSRRPRFCNGKSKTDFAPLKPCGNEGHPRRIFDALRSSACKVCGEKTKAETNTGIVACATCGTEDPDYVPFFAENDFVRDAIKARIGGFGAIEEPMERFEDREEALRDREVPNSPSFAFLSDKEKRLELYEIRRKRVARRLEQDRREREIREAERWEREIREEEARRVQVKLHEESTESTESSDDSDFSEDNESSESSETDSHSDYCRREKKFQTSGLEFSKTLILP